MILSPLAENKQDKTGAADRKQDVSRQAVSGDLQQTRNKIAKHGTGPSEKDIHQQALIAFHDLSCKPADQRPDNN